jgi:hypothetical protein
MRTTQVVLCLVGIAVRNALAYSDGKKVLYNLLQDFLDGSDDEHGAIFVSFGSVLTGARMTRKNKLECLSVSSIDVFYRVKCTLFYMENDAEIFLVHCTWKVAEKRFYNEINLQ